MKATTHLHVVQKLRTDELYIYSTYILPCSGQGKVNFLFPFTFIQSFSGYNLRFLRLG